MRKKISAVNIILVIILFAGLSLLLYPTFSEMWNSTRQSRAIAEYAENVSALNKEQYEELWRQAEEYNQSLAQQGIFYALNEEQKEEYEKLLNVAGHGIMAYIEIPKIDCDLPIYHGTEESVLQVAIGHLEWSSLPVGGTGSHCVVSGHRGLPSARLFTDLDKLEEGDEFYITVLDRKLAYEVDQILTVLPEEVDELGIEEGKDYVTLITCTPYGINTHRLLVRGHRVEYVEPEPEKDDEIVVTRNLTKQFWMTAGLVFGGVAVLVLILKLIFGRKQVNPENNGDRQNRNGPDI